MPLLPLYRNQSTELHSKSIDWFLAFNGLNNLNLNSYSFECFILLLQLRHLQVVPFFSLLIMYHKCRNDLNICTKNELKSNFIESVNRRN